MLGADVVVYGPDARNGAAAVEELFGEVGVTARVGTVEGPPPGLLLASIPIRLLYEQIGTAAERRVADLVGRLSSHQRLIVFQDTETGVQVVVGPGLPEQAFGLLATIDLALYTFGPLLYSVGPGEWRSVLDEWAAAR